MGNAQDENIKDTPVILVQAKDCKSHRTTYCNDSSHWAWLEIITDWCQQNLHNVSIFVAAVLTARMWSHSMIVTDLPFDRLLKLCLEQTIWLNVLLIIYVCFATCVWIMHIYSHQARWWHLFMYPIICACILNIPQWTAIQTCIPHLSYPYLIVECLVVVWSVELGILIYLKAKEIKYMQPADCENGFVVKTKKDELIESGWEKHVETIFELVGKKQLEEESFAIGITGSWGSGKTTFYDAIRDYIERKKGFVLFEFKPWQIIEPSRIAPEFFAEFAEAISGGSNDKQLRQQILKYAQLLSAVPVISPYAQAMAFIFESKEETIASLRLSINEKLDKSNRYVVIMIDDLDRLNKEELLEIMKLIRSSANFKHVLFILTYDKGYFGKILGKKLGVEYLKKIVNVEFSLPPFEMYIYGDLLYQSISNVFNEDITEIEEEKLGIHSKLCILAQLISLENSKDENSVLYTRLSNFRDIKRFANQFGLTLRHLCNLHILNKYYFGDLFWLELLHYVDEDAYNQLQINYHSFLTNNQSKNGQGVLVLNSDISKNSDILGHLFSAARVDKPENSIVWLTNYYSYFAHRQLDNYVSAVDFALLMHQPNEEEVSKKVIGWLSNKHKTNSVIQILKDYPHNFYFESEREAENYTCLLLQILQKSTKNSTINTIVEQFKHKYHQSYFRKATAFNLVTTFERFILHYPNERWNKVLAAMCVTNEDDRMEIDYDSHILEDIENIINKRDIKELARLNFSSYFGKKDMPINELFDSESNYMKFIDEASYVARVDGYKPKEEKTYSNLLGDYLVERFKNSTKSRRKGDKVFAKVYANLLIKAGVNYEEDEYHAQSLINETLEKSLGSASNFGTILNECFRLSKKNIELCENIGFHIQ